MPQKKSPTNVRVRKREKAPKPFLAPATAAASAAAASAPTAGFRRLHYMYGAVTQIELNNFLLGNSIDSDERQREIKAQWRTAAEMFGEIVRNEVGLAEAIATSPINPAHSAIVEEIQNNPSFKKTFSNYPISFEEVEIDKVVASQRTVHLDFVEHIEATCDTSPEALLTFCLHPGQGGAGLTVGRTAGNAFTFTSENPSLRFLDAFEHPYRADLKPGYHSGGQPLHAVTILVGYGSATVNVYRVGNRLILNNGFHRLYALRSLGLTKAPVVVQQITHPELELPPNIADLPRDYLIAAPRPALMKDFFNPALNCEIHQGKFIKAIQIGWGVEDRRVPIQ